MSGFLAGLTGATWGYHTARPPGPARSRGGDGDTRGPDGAATGVLRAVWRNRLAVPGPACAAVWAAAHPALRQAGSDGYWLAWDWVAGLGDRLAPPAGPPPAAGWWWPPVAVLARAAAVAVLWVVAARRWPDRASRWGRLVRRERGWRHARLVEHRWEQAMWDLGLASKRRLGRWRVPVLSGVAMTDWGGFTGRLRLPRGFTASKLDDPDVQTLICRELELGAPYGVCEQIVLRQPRVDRAMWRNVELAFAGLPDPAAVPGDDRPADGGTLRIGLTGRGWLGWDLDRQPFLRLSGSTGKGKGTWLSWIICQAVRAGWLVIIIDGEGSPEYDVWSKLPNVLYYGLDIDDPQAALEEFKMQLALVQRIAARRRRLCLARGKRDMKSLGQADQLANPRILVVFDGFTALVGKAPEDEAAQKARQVIGHRINRMMRLYRKYRVNAVISDQITYAGTYVGSDGVAQATQYVFAGAANPTQQRMLSSGTSWPTVPNESGFGVAGVVGEPHADAMVWGMLSDGDLERIVGDELALWEARRVG